MKKTDLKESYGTLSQTINGLVKLGYTHDFNIKDDCIECENPDTALSPKEFQIDKVYRFEGESDPEYQSVLYAISSEKLNIKGVLVNGYGISSDESTSKLIEKLETHHEQTRMKNKSSSSTAQRPDGERLLNAPLVEMNLNEFIKQIKSESAWTDSDRNSITIFKSETMRIVLIGLHQNAELNPHKANGVISIQVLEGKIEFMAEQQVTQIEKGHIISLQSNINHSIKALIESMFLLTIAMNNK